MDFLPWKTFHRIAQRHSADHRMRTLSCVEQFRVMAFAQLTYWESLRDFEACLQASKLYHMGLTQPVARSILADVNERRDWRICAEFAQRLIVRTRALDAADSFGVELAHTVYALDATTMDLCLSVCPWVANCDHPGWYWALWRVSSARIHSISTPKTTFSGPAIEWSCGHMPEEANSVAMGSVIATIAALDGEYAT